MRHGTSVDPIDKTDLLNNTNALRVVKPREVDVLVVLGMLATCRPLSVINYNNNNTYNDNDNEIVVY